MNECDEKDCIIEDLQVELFCIQEKLKISESKNKKRIRELEYEIEKLNNQFLHLEWVKKNEK